MSMSVRLFRLFRLFINLHLSIPSPAAYLCVVAILIDWGSAAATSSW